MVQAGRATYPVNCRVVVTFAMTVTTELATGDLQTYAQYWNCSELFFLILQICVYKLAIYSFNTLKVLPAIDF